MSGEAYSGDSRSRRQLPRRHFLTTGGLTAASLLAAGCSDVMDSGSGSDDDEDEETNTTETDPEDSRAIAVGQTKDGYNNTDDGPSGTDSPKGPRSPSRAPTPSGPGP